MSSAGHSRPACSDTLPAVLPGTCIRVPRAPTDIGHARTRSPAHGLIPAPALTACSLVAPCIAASDYGRFSYYNVRFCRSMPPLTTAHTRCFACALTSACVCCAVACPLQDIAVQGCVHDAVTCLTPCLPATASGFHAPLYRLHFCQCRANTGMCNCKWNRAWCRLPSIPTMRQGLACGDFASLQVCVADCRTSPPAPGPNVIMSWITSAAVQYSCNAGHYETSTYQGYAPTWTCGLTWSGTAQPVCVRCPLGSYCFGGNKWTCPAGRFGGSTGLTSSSCSGICAGE